MNKPSNHETEEAAKPGLEDEPRSNSGHGNDSTPGATELERGEQLEPKMHSDVSELPAELKELVEQMLVEGATFDETVEAVNERGGEYVTLGAVKNFFRSNLGLQQQRIQKLVATAGELKKAVGATDPDSPEGQLLGAIILTGVMQISREGANFDLRYAVRERLARENLHLQQQKLILQTRKEVAEQDYRLAKAHATIAKAELELQVRKLKKLFKTVDKNRKLDKKTYERIQEVNHLPHATCIRRCCIDQSGLGMMLAERLQKKYGARVEPVQFTAPVKEKLAPRVKQHFEERLVRIPEEREIRADLNAVKRYVTPAGNVRFDAERTERGHADRFWALALALEAASQPVSRLVDAGAVVGRPIAAGMRTAIL